MPAGFEPHTLIPAAIIVLVASLVKGTTGFGFAMVSTPLLLLLWAPRLVVTVVLPLALTIDVLIVFQNRRLLEPRRVVPMALAGALGVPLGTYALVTIPERFLRMGIASLILVAAVLLLMGFSVTIRRERLAGTVAGFMSGILVSSTAVSGPPVALFMINQRWAKDTFRSSLGLFFLTLEVLAIISLLGVGALNGGTILVSAILWTPVLAGYLAATRLLPHIQQRQFLRIATLVVMAAAILAMVNAIR